MYCTLKNHPTFNDLYHRMHAMSRYPLIWDYPMGRYYYNLQNILMSSHSRLLYFSFGMVNQGYLTSMLCLIIMCLTNTYFSLVVLKFYPPPSRHGPDFHLPRSQTIGRFILAAGGSIDQQYNQALYCLYCLPSAILSDRKSQTVPDSPRNVQKCKAP